MGDPIKIVDLVRDMIELSGLKLGEDIDIDFTGLRPGERLYETLFADNEHPECLEHEKIFVNHNGGQAAPEHFTQQGETLIQAALAGDETAARVLLHQLACGEDETLRVSENP